MMKRRNLIAILALYYAALTPVFAQTQSGSVSTDAPKQASGSLTGTHKPKIASPAKKQVVAPDVVQSPAPKTIPMDFSGMAKRPVDLPYGNESSGKATSSEPLPGIGTNSNGGISPGVNMHF